MKVIQNYTLTFEFLKKNFMDIKKQIDLQSLEIYDDKNNSKKSLHILEDGVSGVQVGDIEQVTI